MFGAKNVGSKRDIQQLPSKMFQSQVVFSQWETPFFITKMESGRNSTSNGINNINQVSS